MNWKKWFDIEVKEDIGPVATTEEDEDEKKKKKKQEDNTWFKAGAYEDGYDKGDFLLTVASTLGDATVNVAKGAYGLAEGVSDAILHGVAGVGDLVGADDFADRLHRTATKSQTDEVFGLTEAVLDANSVFGNTMDSVAQSVGQVGTIILTGGIAGAAGASAAGASAITTGLIGLSSMGSGMSEAYQGGATDGQAFAYGTMKGVIDAGTELIFGGLGKAVKALGISRGLTSVDDMFAKKLSSKISSQFWKNATEYGVKASAEGLEEVLAGYGSAVAKKLTYMSDEELEQLVKDEKLLEQFVVGAMVSGIAQSGDLVKSNKQGRDFITNRTQNEEKVFEAEYERRVAAEEKKNGKELTKKQKNEIYEQVQEDLKKGYISTDTIESIFGGEDYKAYKSILEQEKPLRDEIKSIENNDTLTDDQKATLKKAVEEKLQTLATETNKAEVRAKLDKVMESQLVRQDGKHTQTDDYLLESYKEDARSREAFKVDLSKYEGKEKEVLQDLMKKGQVNNTRRAHEFWEYAAKVAAERGRGITSTTTEEILEMETKKHGAEYVEKNLKGKVLNGYIMENGDIAINVNSPNARRFILGHEIGHQMESADGYDKLKELLYAYAESKEGKDAFKKRKDTTDSIYGGIEGADADVELTNDLIGEYLYGDEDFVYHLSTKNPNLFQKIWNEVKYLYKMATAGSQEKRDLLRIQKTFEKAYRESAKSESKTKGKTDYSLSETTDGRFVAVVDDDILSNIDTSSWDKTKKEEAKKAASDALKQFGDGIVVNGITRKVNRVSRREYTRSKDTEWLYNNAPDVFADKMRAADVADDIVVATTGWSRDGGLTHPRNDNFVDFDHGTTLILSGDAKYSAEVVVGITNEGEAVFYDVVDMTPTTFDIKKEESSTTATTQDAIGDIHEDSSDGIVPQNESDVKRDFSLSPEQKEYFKDSVVRDENGDLKVMYHGTSKGGHTVFDTFGSNYGLFGQGSYFTDDKSVAESYTKKGKGNNPQVYESYLNITNPMDMDAEADIKAWMKAVPDADFSNCVTNEDCYRAMEEYLMDEEYSKWEAAEYATDSIMSMGYDGITHIGGGRFNKADETRHQVYIAFNPEQIKNIDNVKPTDSADIRYSLTQDSKGRELTKEQSDFFKDSKIKDENGNLLVMYHGTKKGGFTVFQNKRRPNTEGFYFTNDQKYSDLFQGINTDTGKYYDSVQEGIEEGYYTPETYEVYLDVKNPFVLTEDQQDIIEDIGYWENIYKPVKAAGYDGVMMEDMSQVFVFNSNQIKRVDNANPTSDADIRYSLSNPQTDKDYTDAVDRGDTETAQKIVEDVAKEAGYTIRAYHGTGRSDRVGNVFRPDRATSGPMAFFTDNKDIADNYASNKKDTSLAYDTEYDSYYTQFRVNRNGKNVSIPELWNYLSFSERNSIKEKAKHIKFDDDYEAIIVDPTAQHGNGAWDAYTLNYHRGNALEALVDTWLETGDLFNREADFLEVLEHVGISGVEYRDPDARYEKTYDTWLKIQNPFDTDNANQSFYDSLSEWTENNDMSVYEKESSNADFWDKNNQSPESWLDKLSHDIENGTTHAWTVIPDFVTDYLKQQGYDGIKDKGGKGGGAGHTVWIPFSSEQVKSAETVTYDDNGNIIPLSERFNADNVDIRYSLSREGDAPIRFGNEPPMFDRLVKPTEEDIAPVSEDIAKNATTTEDIAPLAESEIAPTQEFEAIKPRPEKLKGEEAQWAKNKMARADKATTEEQQTAQILTEEPETAKKKSRGWSKFKANFLDKGAVFEDLSLKTKNRKLMAKWNHTLSSESRAQWMIGNGREGVKSLNAIREEVESTGLTKEFYDYLYHKHNVDRMNLEGRYEDIKNKPVFGYDVTAEKSQEVVNQYEFAEPKFKEYAQDVYDYMNYLRKQLVDNGVISQETADLWAEMYPHYVPIRRVGDSGLNINVPLDTGRTGVNAPIKQATGGNRDILPLFDTMAMRTEQTFKAIARNSFGVELKNTLGTGFVKNKANFEEVVDSIEKQEELLQKGENGRNPTFTVFENGEKVTFEITEDMYDALKPTSEGLRYTNKVANTVSNVHRGLLTEYNPVFTLTNAIKDVQDVLINSKHARKTYAKMPTAIKELSTKGKWYTEYMENGGEQNTYFDGKTNTFKADDKGFKKLIGIPLGAVSKANDFVERAPRLAEYIASREAGASIEEAMLDAARVTTNFAAGGDVTKFLNRNGATFLNASVQGAMQQVRNVREAKANGAKGVLQLATKFAIVGLGAELLNHLLWDDDEEYEELSDYVKQNYYVVAKYGDGQFVRIPKGRTLAVIQNAFAQVGNTLTGDDEADWGSVFDLAFTNLAPNNPVEDNILAPIIQVANNKTWYGEDLVPTRLQDLPASEQFDESTDALSKWLGETFNISPYKLNYLLNQYSGGVGDVVLPMLTPEAESGNNSLVGNITAPLKDKFTTNSTMNNQNVSDFYDTMDELTVNAKASTATDEDILKYKYFNSVNSDLGELYAMKREIQNSDLPDDKKYDKVFEIQEEINALARKSLNTYNNVYIEGDYAEIGDLAYKLNKNGEWQKLTDDQRDKQKAVMEDLGISASDYWSDSSEYNFASKYPDRYAVAKSVGGYDSYKNYMSDLYDIKADKDEYGKSISGSRKEKVLDYINNLDADYGTRIILYKSEYKSDDTYNYDIIEYLESRDDISYEEMVAILKELGFSVSSDGYISWD